MSGTVAHGLIGSGSYPGVYIDPALP